jgi:hypothetical protein
MQKTGKPSRQKVGSEVSGRAREVFKAAGVYPSQDIEVSSGVCQAAAERGGRAGAPNSRTSRTAWSIWLPAHHNTSQAGGQRNKQEAGTSYLESRGAESATEAASPTKDWASR